MTVSLPPAPSVPVSNFESEAISILVAIVVLATVAALVSKNASTGSVISSASAFYAKLISKVTSPISGAT